MRTNGIPWVSFLGLRPAAEFLRPCRRQLERRELWQLACGTLVRAVGIESRYNSLKSRVFCLINTGHGEIDRVRRVRFGVVRARVELLHVSLLFPARNF